MTRHARIPGFLAGPYLLLLALAWMPAVSCAQNANDGFDPNANNSLLALAVQPDGKMIVGGLFTTIAGQTRNRLARLNPDGSLDTGFAATDVNGAVNAIAVQADGRIVIGGGFAQVGGQLRNYIARLNADGTVDTAFNPNASNSVFVLVVQPDGKLVVGGGFTSLSPNGGVAITRNNIARLNVDSSVDTAFNPSPNSVVNALAVQPDGKLVVGGGFTSLSPNGGGAITRNRLARLNANGNVDTAFNPNANSVVTALAVQPDGKLLVGGAFTSLSPNGDASIMRNNMARLNVDGSVDTAFDPNANSVVNALAVQSDGKLLVGGAFTSLSPNGGVAIMRNNMARLNVDGSVDTAFDPNANNMVFALAVQPDGKVLVGGNFFSLSPNGGSAVTRPYIARLYADGTVDAALNSNANDRVQALAVQPDGKLLAGGRFTSLAPNGGVLSVRNRIARLRVDGSVDTAFNPNANGEVNALAVQPDGKLLAGGLFTSLAPNGGGAITRNYIVRLNADGSVDTAFNPNPNNSVNALALQFDGKLVVSGSYTSLSPNGGSAITRNRIARLNADGSVDTAFDPNANFNVNALALLPDSKLVVGGVFTSLSPNGGGAIPRNYIARLNADGSMDTAFDPKANNSVFALAVQSDGKLVVGGFFTSLSPNGGAAITRNYIARLNADGSVDTAFNPNPNNSVTALAMQTDGKLVLGGSFTSLSPNGGDAVTRNRIARLNADGSVDTTFDPNAAGTVFALAVQSDGKVVAGGVFTAMGSLSRNFIARLSTPQAALQSVSIDTYSAGGSSTTWTRSGAGPELALPPQLLFSLNGSTYAPVGTMQRITSGWNYSGFVPPLNQNFYLRTRGQVSSGGTNGSSGLIESTRLLYLTLPDDIFANGFE